MSSLLGRIVHYRTAGICEVVICIEDSPPNFTIIVQGNRLQRGLLGVLDSAARDNISKYTTLATESDKWHNIAECPYNT